MKKILQLLKAVFLIVTFLIPIVIVADISQTFKALPTLGSQEILGKLDGIDIEVLVQS